MFGARIQREARRFVELVVRPLAAIGITPNVATLLGLVLNSATAVILATGQLRIGGVGVLIAGVFDMFDGALARVQHRKTVFGAFFDSTLDRYSEGLLLLGVLLYVVGQPPTAERTWVVALTYLAALSSLMVSYAKARAEGLGLQCRIGLMARPERVLLLAIGLILGGSGWLVWTMAALAATSTFTAVQRIVHVWRAAQAQQPRVVAPPPASGEAIAVRDSAYRASGSADPHRAAGAERRDISLPRDALPPSAH
jgi:CDP-diacylglycerol--glycerol-3-phosphate 3-phosphatidyltransferase